jgi:hypothetical protein
MAGKGSSEMTPLRVLQRYHHTTLNTFGDGETLVEAIHKRPGCYGPNPIAFLSLLARRPGLTLGDVDEALINDRSLVRATAFRGSLFLIPSEDYPIYFRAMYDTLSASGMSRLRSEGIDEHELSRLSDRLRTANFPHQRTEKQILDLLYPGKERRPGADVEKLLLRKLCDLGVLVRTTSKGWKGNHFNYALTTQWLDGITLTVEQVEQARLEVVRRYLRAYGPARLEDIAWWTGMPAGEVRQMLDLLGREVVRFAVDGLGEGLVTLRETAEATRKGGSGNPDRILFLPLWDAYPLGWRDRTRVVEPRFAPWVYDPQGNTTSIIVEEGRAIGLWQFRDGDTITLEFHVFEPYNNRLNALRLAAEDYAGELAKVAGARDLRVVERALPVPLAERPAASFLWPLGKEPIFRHSDADFDSPMDRRERTPNVLRSRFLDDERLVRPMLEEEQRRRQLRDRTTTLDGMGEGRAEPPAAETPPKVPVEKIEAAKAAKSTPPTPAKAVKSTPPTPAKAAKSTPPTPAKAAKSTPPIPAKAAKSTPPTPAKAAKSTPPTPAKAAKSTPPTPAKKAETKKRATPTKKAAPAAATKKKPAAATKKKPAAATKKPAAATKKKPAVATKKAAAAKAPTKKAPATAASRGKS